MLKKLASAAATIAIAIGVGLISTVTASGAGPVDLSTTVTFFAAYDNTPPLSTAIAYPSNGGYGTVHNTAGGTGTWADPMTIAAADAHDFPVGSRLWVPRLSKYGIVEDSCASCTGRWVDVYIPEGFTPAVRSCEDVLTQSAPETVEVNPPATYRVNSNAVWDPNTGRC